MQAPVFLLEIQHLKQLKSVFLKIYNCAWKPAFLKIQSHISKAGGLAAHFDFTSFLTRLFSSYLATPILHLGYFGLEEISLKFQVFSLVYPG